MKIRTPKIDFLNFYVFIKKSNFLLTKIWWESNVSSSNFSEKSLKTFPIFLLFNRLNSQIYLISKNLLTLNKFFAPKCKYDVHFAVFLRLILILMLFRCLCGCRGSDLSRVAIGVGSFLIAVMYITIGRWNKLNWTIFESLNFIILGLFALVRFWMFTHVYYTVFMVSTTIIGVIMVIHAIVIILDDYVVSIHQIFSDFKIIFSFSNLL